MHGSNGPPAGRPELTPWQDVASRQAEQLANERVAVVFGSTLLVILALASLVVLVGGRMTDEVRRIGMLKAAGATPGFVTRLLLTSYLAIGLVAAVLGIAGGRLLAPRLVTLSAGLLGNSGATTLTMAEAATVVASSSPSWSSRAPCLRGVQPVPARCRHSPTGTTRLAEVASS